MRQQLEAAIRQTVQLDTQDENKLTQRQHLLSAVEQLRKAGKTEDELTEMFPILVPVKLERGTEYLMDNFWALHDTRGVGFSGPLAITYIDIKAYCELMQEPLSPWEIETIRAIDRAFLEENRKLDAPKE